MSSNDVVAALVRAGLLQESDAVRAREVVAEHEHRGQGVAPGVRSVLVEVAGYLGAALVIAAFGLFLADNWAELTNTQQVLALGGIAFALEVAGVVVVTLGRGLSRGFARARAGEDEVRRRLASALVTGGAVAAAFTVGQIVELSRDDYSSWPLLLGSLTLMGLAALGYWALPSVIGQAGIAVGLIGAAAASADVADSAQHESVVVGLTLFVGGVLWVLLAESGVFAELVWARSIGSALALLGAQVVQFSSDFAWLAYALTLAVAVVAFVLYAAKLSWPYLVVGVGAVTLVVPEAIIDWTDGSLGVAGAVLIAGLALLGASVTGLRLREEALD